MTTSMEAAPAAELPQEEFWSRYNKRFEFPLSTVVAVLMHAIVGALLVFVLFQLMKSSPRNSGVPVTLVDFVGMDNDGDGSPGSGKDGDSLKAAPDPWKDSLDLLPSPSDLPRVEADVRNIIDDPNGKIAISPANLPQYDKLDEKLRNMLLMKPGSSKGSGGGMGKGDAKQPGDGPGGVANSSQSRSLRWVLRFTTIDGQDYLDQLAAMGAVILIPLPPDNKDCLYFPNLKKPGERRTATEDDLKKLAGQVRFSDGRAESVRGVCQALGVNQSPRTFWAFFPKELEDDLARKEIGFRNRRPENVAETVFRIALRDGKIAIQVVAQTARE